MNPSRTLRKFAETLPDGDLKTYIFQLAAELEVQHNSQNNAFQGALSNAELGLGNQLDVLTGMIAELRSGCNNSLAQSQQNAPRSATWMVAPRDPESAATFREMLGHRKARPVIFTNSLAAFAGGFVARKDSPQR